MHLTGPLTIKNTISDTFCIGSQIITSQVHIANKFNNF